MKLPPSIISVFLGEPLTQLFDSLANGKEENQSCRRNRGVGREKPPEAAQGFFRQKPDEPFCLYGQQIRIQDGCIVPVRGHAQHDPERRRRGKPRRNSARNWRRPWRKGKDPIEASMEIAGASWKAHKRIVFNGNGYSSEWIKEASARGLPLFRSAVDAIPGIHARLERRHALESGDFDKGRSRVEMHDLPRALFQADKHRGGGRAGYGEALRIPRGIEKR